MLVGINVKNLALIKESEIMLGPGLNILTGETGAGKSIILGSIRLALGERARMDMIRTGEEYALIELIFSSDCEAVVDKLKELDIPIESDGNIYIQRKIMNGKSICKCNGELVSGKSLKELASMLINIHGQNDAQTLLDVKNYLDILDDYGSERIYPLRDDYVEKYREYQTALDELEKEQTAGRSAGRDVSLAQFELDEINNARLVIGEDEELESKYHTMTHGKKIAEALSKAYSALSGDGTASDQVGYALREVGSVVQYSDSISDINDNLATIEDMIKDAARDMQSYIERMDFSEQEFREIEERLDVINRLKSKYGDSIEDILKYADERESFIEKMTDHDAYVEKLNKKVMQCREVTLASAEKLSNMRGTVAMDLQEAMTANLKELNFLSVSFEIAVDSNVDALCESGMDSVDFLVSFNVGEPLRSLSLVASGGELSRFMLALKAVTANKDMVETLIFDEIDAGISGATAWSVAEKMAYISHEHQVIAITHLPQIAAMADSHYLISKDAMDDSTVTNIVRLKKEEQINEVARLMSTGEVTDTVLSGAKELIDNAVCAKAGMM